MYVSLSYPLTAAAIAPRPGAPPSAAILGEGEKEEGRTSKGASERPEQETQAGLAGSGRWEVPKET